MVKHCNSNISTASNEQYHFYRKLIYSEYPNTYHNLVIFNIIVFLISVYKIYNNFLIIV